MPYFYWSKHNGKIFPAAVDDDGAYNNNGKPKYSGMVKITKEQFQMPIDELAKLFPLTKDPKND